MNQANDVESAIHLSHHQIRRYILPLLLVLWISDLPMANSMILPMTTTTLSKRFHSSKTMISSSWIQSYMFSTKIPSSSIRSNCCGRGVISLMSSDTSSFVVPFAFALRSESLGMNRHHHQQRQMRLFSSNSDAENETTLSIDGKKRIVFLGSPPVAAESLRRIHEASQQSDSVYDIVAVISQPPKRAKRGGKVEHTAVAQMAQQLNISTILTPEKANDPLFLQDFCDVRPDLCITAAYGQYLPKKFLQAPKYGTINIHPSLLPKWRGASPVQRSLEAGDNPLGVTVLYTISKMDAGPIIAQTPLGVQDHETATTLLPKLFQIGTQSLIDVLPKVLDETITMSTATIQDEEAVTYAKLIETSEAEFKVWQETATSCHNRLRGFHMWPKAYMYIQITNKNNDNDDPPFVIKLKIHETRVIPDLRLPPTDIIQTSLPTTTTTASSATAPAATGLYVVCYDGSVLELIQIQPPSKNVYPARDLVHGYPNATIRWIQQEQSDVEISNGKEANVKEITAAAN